MNKQHNETICLLFALNENKKKNIVREKTARW